MAMLQWQHLSCLSILHCSRDANTLIHNPGAQTVPTIQETDFNGDPQIASNLYSKVHGLRPKSNAPKSPYLRAISRRMIIQHERLTLLQIIGEGMYTCMQLYIHVINTLLDTGAFGIVYKAKLSQRHGKSIVAVKTLKGRWFLIRRSLFWHSTITDPQSLCCRVL